MITVPCHNPTCFWRQPTHQGRIRGLIQGRRGVAGERLREGSIRSTAKSTRVRAKLCAIGNGVRYHDVLLAATAQVYGHGLLTDRAVFDFGSWVSVKVASP